MTSRHYLIVDELHSEEESAHGSFEAAVQRLKELATIHWDEEPNRAPCTSWETCGRQYEIVEYEGEADSRSYLRTIPALEVSAKGVVWDSNLPPAHSA